MPKQTIIHKKFIWRAIKTISLNSSPNTKGAFEEYYA